jgi:hypothetical protein
MRKISLTQLADYFVLLFFTGLSIVLTLLANGNKQLITYIIIGLSILYVIWGMAHHKNEKSLTKEIVFEYIAISILGAALVIGLL